MLVLSAYVCFSEHSNEAAAVPKEINKVSVINNIITPVVTHVGKINLILLDPN